MIIDDEKGQLLNDLPLGCGEERQSYEEQHGLEQALVNSLVVRTKVRVSYCHMLSEANPTHTERPRVIQLQANTSKNIVRQSHRYR